MSRTQSTTLTSDVSATPADPAMLDAPSNKTVAYTAIVAFLSWTFAVYDLITFGNLLPVIQKSFGWSNATASFVVTAISLGSLVVALAVGPMIDLWGRRNALFATTAGAALSSGLASIAAGPLSMIGIRALSGFGMSEQAVNAAYLNEMFGARNKGVLYGLVQAGWPVGVMLSAAIAGTFTESLGWRAVFLIGTFPLIIVFFLRMGLKESPYFLKLQHLKQLRRAGQIEDAEALGKKWSLSAGSESRNTYAELFSKPFRRQSIALGLAFFFKVVSDSQMTVLATSILAQTKGIALSGALWTVFIGNAVAIVGYVVLGWLGDWIGRRETVIGAQVLTAICVLLLLFVAQGFVPVVVCYSLILFFAQGAAAPLFAYIGESFPTRIRGSGAAYIGVTGPIGGIFGPLLYGVLLSAGYSPVDAAVSGAIAALATAAVLLLAHRIKPGRALEEAGG